MKGAPAAMMWLAVLATAMACSDSGDDTPAEPELRLFFTPTTVSFGEGRTAVVKLVNLGDGAAGPVELVPLSITDAGGTAVPGATLSVSPSAVPTLNPGASRDLELTVGVSGSVGSGEYGVALEARVAGTAAAKLEASFTVPVIDESAIQWLEISGGASSARQGDVQLFTVAAADGLGSPVPDPEVSWRVEPAFAGFVTGTGEFVGQAVGTASLIVEAGDVADTKEVEITERGAPAGSFDVAWHEPVELRYTSDHWEHGDVAYTGTWGCRAVTGGGCGDRLYVWDIGTRDAPVLTDSIQVDARVVNDVKVRQAGDLAIITHEGSTDGQNGVTLLDLADPLHPSVITRFAPPDLSPGVHNVWIDGDYAYLVVDGSVPSSGLRVLDISDPAHPVIVASFYGGSSFLHDVYVRDGLAFLSHWTAGLIVLDVGNGVAGGAPTNPVEVGRLSIPGYDVHNAWYWPEARYVFLGDEVHVPGRVMVVDAADPANLSQVASFTLPGAAPHNFWLDESSGIAYFSWYENGVHAVDVSGRLLGALEKQARQVAAVQYDLGGACFQPIGTCTWAPQLHDGLVYVSDLNSGLWVLRPTF